MEMDHILKCTQLLLLTIFIFSTFSFHPTLTSILSGSTLIGIFLIKVFDRHEQYDKQTTDNPLKGKPKAKTLSKQQDDQANDKITQFVTYDATSNSVIDRFSVLKNKSPCVFAKNAEIWSSNEWNFQLSLEENIFRCLPTFYKFILSCEQLGLDGFVFELPGTEYCSAIEVFARNVKRVLKVLSDNDPAEIRSLNKSYIDKRGWVFEFNRVTMFITCFAPFYPRTNSRHNYGCSDGYILMQPEISFAQHDLPTDTTHTNWGSPKTVRDRIRIAFKDAGQKYQVHDPLLFPMAYDIVKPLEEGDAIIEWWEM